jgi:CDP-diacylglycerol--serine O-phosphatidyltransferase
MPSPAAAAVTASTVYLYPWGLQDPRAAAPALAMVLVPAFLMVSTIRFRSIKTIDVGWRRSLSMLFVAVVTVAIIAAHPRLALVVLSYGYTVWGLAALAYARLRRRPATPPPAE